MGEILKVSEGVVWTRTDDRLVRVDRTGRMETIKPPDKAGIPPATRVVRSYVGEQLAPTRGPIVIATDYVRAVPEQIRAFLPPGRRCVTLGTDGFGRSDSRDNLRRFFEVNRNYVTVAALKALADEGDVPAQKVADAIRKYGIDSAKPAPWTV